MDFVAINRPSPALIEANIKPALMNNNVTACVLSFSPIFNTLRTVLHQELSLSIGLPRSESATSNKIRNKCWIWDDIITVRCQDRL